MKKSRDGDVGPQCEEPDLEEWVPLSAGGAKSEENARGLLAVRVDVVCVRGHTCPDAGHPGVSHGRTELPLGWGKIAAM